MSTFRNLVAGVIAAVATAPLLLAASAPAQADVTAAAYTPEQVCGSGYSKQESKALSGATVYLMYNGSTNCAVTIKTSSVGVATRITAGLQVTGSEWSYDTGDYKYYAGPVKLYAKGKCVRFFGYHGGTSYTSPWGHCG